MLFYVAAGGALGASLRYGLAELARHWTSLPLATLAANVLGCLLAGYLFSALQLAQSTGAARAFLITGLLGGFTTFSSFSLETLLLMEQHGYGRAGAYVLASVLLCLTGAWAGMSVGRQWIA